MPGICAVGADAYLPSPKRRGMIYGSPNRTFDYPAAVLADSPYLYWRFGEPSGTTAEDSSPNNRDGTYVNSPTLGAAGLMPGNPSATSVNFANDGTSTSRYCISANFGTLVPVGFSVEAIINMTASTPGSEQWIAGIDEVASNSPQVSFAASDAQVPTLGAGTADAGGSASVISTTTLSFGTTYHVAWTYNSSTGVNTIYINGSVDKQDSDSIGVDPICTGFPFVAGINRFNGVNIDTGFNGRMQEVAFYTTPLSAARILAHFNQTGL